MPRGYANDDGTRSSRPDKRAAIRAIQNGQSFVYALATKQGAIKIGVSCDVALRTSSGIRFGGTERILAFRPGSFDEEQEIHRRLAPFALPFSREYYYPADEVIEVVLDIASHFNLYRPNDLHDFPDIHQIAAIADEMVARSA